MSPLFFQSALVVIGGCNEECLEVTALVENSRRGASMPYVNTTDSTNSALKYLSYVGGWKRLR